MSPAEQTREDVAAARIAFRDTMRHVAPADLVFLDESGIATNLVRIYGRAPRGERARGTAPYGRWERMTIFGALSPDGITACMSLEGAADTDAMVAFVEQVLTPTLHPGQVVCLDNLNVHKAERVRELVEAAGCTLLFLPPYSPDFNPIEQAWSKLKAARCPRFHYSPRWTLPALVDTGFTLLSISRTVSLRTVSLRSRRD